MNIPQFYSDKALAARYGVSRSTIWHWVQHDKLPKPVQVNGVTRWRSRDIEALKNEPVQPGGAS